MSSPGVDDVKYQTVSRSAIEADVDAIYIESSPCEPTMSPIIGPQNSNSRARKVQRRTDWRIPFRMIGLLIAGVSLAVIHHVFYPSLNGNEARSDSGQWDPASQQWNIRYGTALAFLVKTCFAGSVAIAYHQHIWQDFRSTQFTVQGISALFAVVHDVASFLHWEILMKAKIGMILAIITWLLPLSALITPSTLTVASQTSKANATELVPSIYFSRNKSFQIGETDQVTPVLGRLAASTGSSGSFLSIAAPIPRSSYRTDFLGPSLRCGPPNSTKQFSYHNEKLSAEDMIRRIYDATYDWFAGDITSSNETLEAVIYMATSPMNIPYLNDGGDSDFTAWTQFAVQCIVSTGLCPMMAFAANSDALWIQQEKENIACALYETNYTVQFEASNITQEIRSVEFEFLQPIQEPSISYFFIVHSLVDLLAGALTVSKLKVNDAGAADGRAHGNSTYFTQVLSTRTRIWSTLLIGALNIIGGAELQDPLEHSPNRPLPSISQEDRALTRGKTLGFLIEELSRNLTMNLFSDPRFLNMNGYSTIVTTTSSKNVYRYASRNLFLSYGIAILATLFGVAVGIRALLLNGVVHSTNFAAIVATTRDASLATMTEGASMGNEPMPKEMLQAELRFGALDATHGHIEDGQQTSDDTRARRVGFGLAGQVEKLEKEGYYV